MIKILTTTFLTFFMTHSFAESLPPWKDFMADHEFKGCPQHSTCTQKMGARFLQFETSLKTNNLKSFFNKNGIPITGRRLKVPSSLNDAMTAIWDSPCDYKKEKKSSFERVTTFSKIVKNPQINYPIYFLITGDNKLTMIPASSDDSALAFEEKRLVFNRIYKNNYYQYQVNNQGRIFIKEDISVPKFSEHARCRKSHLDIISNYLDQEEIVQLNCRNIYDKKGRKSYLFYLPRCE